MYQINHIFRLVYYCLFSMAVILSGCIPQKSMDQINGPKFFDLKAPWNLGTEWEREYIEFNNVQLFVMKPKVDRSLSKNKIKFVTNGNQIGYFSDWYWSDDLASLIQARMVEVLEPFFRGVGTIGQGVSIDYRIVPEIRAFQLEEIVKGKEVGRVKHCLEYTSSFEEVLTKNIEEIDEITNVIEGNEEEVTEYWAVVEIATKVIHERYGNVILQDEDCAKMKVESRTVRNAVEGLNLALREVLTENLDLTSHRISREEFNISERVEFEEREREHNRLQWECEKQTEQKECDEYVDNFSE